MQDSLNALQSYLDTLKDKGFFFSFNNHNNEYYILVCFSTVINVAINAPDFKDTQPCTESGISELLESVEKYVESRIK
ncbi:hypothetical protein [Myroides odoratimimus]|uniref:hypothetical protein n=1 Tax=Myroides odoratimimus TaxID=76832 RepID=UPI0025785C02|nr:hypothetical protein [Myroides odoratimimus]MDM1513566.1 hypothetical protein [Myroides odoratimimus]